MLQAVEMALTCADSVLCACLMCVSVHQPTGMLQAVEMFQHMEPLLCREVCNLVEYMSVPEGTVLFEEGDRVDFCYIVLSVRGRAACDEMLHCQSARVAHNMVIGGAIRPILLSRLELVLETYWVPRACSCNLRLAAHRPCLIAHAFGDLMHCKVFLCFAAKRRDELQIVP